MVNLGGHARAAKSWNICQIYFMGLAWDRSETLIKSDIGVLPICDCKPTRLLFYAYFCLTYYSASSTPFLPWRAHGGE